MKNEKRTKAERTKWQRLSQNRKQNEAGNTTVANVLDTETKSAWDNVCVKNLLLNGPRIEINENSYCVRLVFTRILVRGIEEMIWLDMESK